MSIFSLFRVFLLLGVCTHAFSQEIRVGDTIKQKHTRRSQAHTSADFSSNRNLLAYVLPGAIATVLEIREFNTGLGLKVQFFNRRELELAPQYFDYLGDFWVFYNYRKPLYEVIESPSQRAQIKESHLRDRNAPQEMVNKRNIPLDITLHGFQFKLRPQSFIDLNRIETSDSQKLQKKVASNLFSFPKFELPSFEEQVSTNTSFQNENIIEYKIMYQDALIPLDGFDGPILEVSSQDIFEPQSQVSHFEIQNDDLDLQAPQMPYNDLPFPPPIIEEPIVSYQDLDISQMQLEDLKIMMETIRQKIFDYAQVHPLALYERTRSDIRDRLFAAMYRLDPNEREMAAAVFTAWGEARSAVRNKYDSYDAKGRAEMLAVISVLYTRAQDKQYQYDQDIEILDVALQPKQFSMYSLRDPNWPKAFMGPQYAHELEEASFNVALLAYQDYKKGVRIPGFENATHFCRPNVNASWRRGYREVAPFPPKVNIIDAGTQKITLHRFYHSVPWEYNTPDWKYWTDYLKE